MSGSKRWVVVTVIIGAVVAHVFGLVLSNAYLGEALNPALPALRPSVASSVTGFPSHLAATGQPYLFVAGWLGLVASILAVGVALMLNRRHGATLALVAVATGPVVVWAAGAALGLVDYIFAPESRTGTILGTTPRELLGSAIVLLVPVLCAAAALALAARMKTVATQ